ncbi:cell division protein FtsA [Helicobacter monodelphidis]|uniref:cell division protein FtsA n=1 Tax=Helicobacter sp. 15-1451 TaxID=2004995 RepID=UPI000DCD36BC|nr:cell division protein FtsA [Helicobacter sp. 15-1451]RAX58660.1 cell division protein FtsA [Helicobacter sp. 15-1451]
MNNETILGIDVGTSKVCAIIAEVKDGIPHVIGTGLHKSQGLRKGAIANIELASRAIKAAINDAKRVAGTNCSKAIISISGVYTKSFNSSGIVNIPNSEIGTQEINRVMQTALYNATIPQESEVIHVLPYSFKVDDQDFIDDPMGMNGNRIEVFVHIVCAQRSSLNNLKKAVRSSGVEVANIVLSAYASAIAVLNDDEREQGVACIDMGGSTCDLIIHAGNSIRYNDFLGVGSQHITNDLAMILSTPIAAAEEVKIRFGSLRKESSQSGDKIELPTTNDEKNIQTTEADVVYNIIYARTEETLMFLAKFLEKSSLQDHLGAGVVLTGGMVKLEGIRELASAIFTNMPVRIAKPHDVLGLFESLRDPSYSTVVGLILYGAGHFTNYEIDSEKKLLVRMGKFNNEDVNISLANPTHEVNALKDLATQSPNQTTSEEIKTNSGRFKNMKQVDHETENFMSRFWRWLTQLF